MAASNSSRDATVDLLDALVGQQLVDVVRLCYVPSEPNESGWIEGIQLTLDSASIWISVDPDYDALAVQRAAAPAMDDEQVLVNARRSVPWRRWIGKPLRFAWIGINHRGYLDTVTVGFDHYSPSVCIVAVASRIVEYTVSQVQQRTRR